MRINILVTNDIRFDQRMIRIAYTLHKSGYQIQMTGRKKKNSAPLSDYPFQTHLIHCFFTKGIAFYLEFNLRLFIYLIKCRTSLIYAVDLDTMPASYLYHLVFSIPFVFDSHEYFTEVPELQKHPVKKKIWEILGKISIPAATFSFTVSESLAVQLKQKYKVPFITLRNVPSKKSPVMIDLNQRRERRWIYYQGMLNEGRGIAFLIQTMVLLPSWTLILAGDGDEIIELKQLVKQLGLNKQVIFKGMIEPGELTELGKMAWIGINLLEKNSLSYYYSLANKTFDYMQARLPAIHIDFPEYRLLAKENKCILLLEKMDSSLLVELIENAWRDTKWYESMLSDTEKAAATYIWEEEEKKLLAPFFFHFPLSRDTLQ